MAVKLKFSLEDVVQAMQTQNYDFEQYVDLETGEIIIADDDFEEAIFDETDDGEDRYIYIDPILSGDQVQMMEDFISELNEGKESDALTEAIGSIYPVRAFYEAILKNPALFQQWKQYEEKQLNDIAREWLDDNGLSI